MLFGLSARCTLSVQEVDATPSGIKLFSKVVFMTQRKRFGLSAVQKRDVWRRWKAGQSLHEIGRAFGKEHSSIRCLVSRYGGFVPAVRRRSLLALTPREREELSRGIVSGRRYGRLRKAWTERETPKLFGFGELFQFNLKEFKRVTCPFRSRLYMRESRLSAIVSP